MQSAIHSDGKLFHCIHSVLCEPASHTGMCVLPEGHVLVFVSFLGGCIPGKVKIAPVILGFPIKRILRWHIILPIKGPNINIYRNVLKHHISLI